MAQAEGEPVTAHRLGGYPESKPHARTSTMNQNPIFRPTAKDDLNREFRLARADVPGWHPEGRARRDRVSDHGGSPTRRCAKS